MKILAIETSCDETAIAVVEATEKTEGVAFKVLGNALFSQTIHKDMGGVVPMLAKREHAKNLVPLLVSALEEAGMEEPAEQNISLEIQKEIETILSREEGLSERLFKELEKIAPPHIDAIAVTTGPGLEPALWVGINFAKALSLLWEKPIIPVNHMEGHIAAALLSPENGLHILTSPPFPALALLISGGHTELLLMHNWSNYVLVGETRDDAVGEAFDKVARMLGLPYPGGPEISRLAEAHRKEGGERTIKLPRPMRNSGDCDFSFAGLKTAALYTLKKIPNLTEAVKKEIAREFEDAVGDVLEGKTKQALDECGAQSLIAGGGVTANIHVRKVLEQLAQKEGIPLYYPSRTLSTDNAVMIAVAGFLTKDKPHVPPTASGTLKTARA